MHRMYRQRFRLTNTHTHTHKTHMHSTVLHIEETTNKKAKEIDKLDALLRKEQHEQQMLMSMGNFELKSLHYRHQIQVYFSFGPQLRPDRMFW